jgi:hypothetical protein
LGFLFRWSSKGVLGPQFVQVGLQIEFADSNLQAALEMLLLLKRSDDFFSKIANIKIFQPKKGGVFLKKKETSILSSIERTLFVIIQNGTPCGLKKFISAILEEKIEVR